MTIDPFNAWAVIRDGQVRHLRMKKEVAEASAYIEQQAYGYKDVKVVPILVTEIGNPDDAVPQKTSNS